MARCLLFPGPGESGAIELVRTQAGKELDAVDLSDVLGEHGTAILPRYAGTVRFSARALASAAPIPLMVLRDVNLDGIAAEFLLPGKWQVTNERMSALAGFSPTDHKVFAFLAQSQKVWESVATMKTELEIITLPCLDHASPDEYFDLFKRGPKGVTRSSQRWACTVPGDKVIRTKMQEATPDIPLGL